MNSFTSDIVTAGISKKEVFVTFTAENSANHLRWVSTWQDIQFHTPVQQGSRVYVSSQGCGV